MFALLVVPTMMNVDSAVITVTVSDQDDTLDWGDESMVVEEKNGEEWRDIKGDIDEGNAQKEKTIEIFDGAVSVQETAPVLNAAEEENVLPSNNVPPLSKRKQKQAERPPLDAEQRLHFKQVRKAQKKSWRAKRALEKKLKAAEKQSRKKRWRMKTKGRKEDLVVAETLTRPTQTEREVTFHENQPENKSIEITIRRKKKIDAGKKQF